MKKFGIIFFLSVLTSSVFGQQFLWSTIEKDTVKNVKYIPLSRVIEEVLNLYDLYELYYDFSGFTKEGLIDSGNTFGLDEMKKLDEIIDLSVYAMRANLGKGSFIMVACISRENINMIIFSNTAFVSGMSSMRTYSSDREKFKKWFETLLN